MNGSVLSVCISEKKGTKKHPILYATAVTDFGFVGDAHAGDMRAEFHHRQVSLLANESVEKMRALGLTLSAGDFAENILTQGIELKKLPIGTRLKIGEAELEISQIGKECHSDCEIKKQTGKCVMPTEGVFAVVTKSGEIHPNDEIIILN